MTNDTTPSQAERQRQAGIRAQIAHLQGQLKGGAS